MRFTIKQAGCGSERVGCLTGFVKSINTVIETPTSALFTQSGSVVHLTADVLLTVFTNPQLLWMPLSNTLPLETGVKAQGEGIAKFAGLPGQISCASSYNINDGSPQGHFEQDRVPLWTKNGKQMINADRYMDVMEVFKPDMILAIADGRTSVTETKKRMIKSVERTCKMLETCVARYKASTNLQKSSLIGVVVGVGQDKTCNECIEHILKHKEIISGVALAGITDGTDDSYKVAEERLPSIFEKVGKTLPNDLLRIVEGSWNPAVVLSAVEQGWDIFDGSYPLKLTNAGHALALTFDVDRNSDELCILDMNDIRYQEDFNPIIKGCECLACRKHTRAYIRHLLNTREMLASVLLNIHNLHHFDEMFRYARRHIVSNTFKEYKRHITQQYELYMASVPEKGKSDISECVADINGISGGPDKTSSSKKKIKVSASNNRL